MGSFLNPQHVPCHLGPVPVPPPQPLLVCSCALSSGPHPTHGPACSASPGLGRDGPWQCLPRVQRGSLSGSQAGCLCHVYSGPPSQLRRFWTLLWVRGFCCHVASSSGPGASASCRGRRGLVRQAGHREGAQGRGSQHPRPAEDGNTVPCCLGPARRWLGPRGDECGRSAGDNVTQ